MGASIMKNNKIIGYMYSVIGILLLILGNLLQIAGFKFSKPIFEHLSMLYMILGMIGLIVGVIWILNFNEKIQRVSILILLIFSLLCYERTKILVIYSIINIVVVAVLIFSFMYDTKNSKKGLEETIEEDNESSIDIKKIKLKQKDIILIAVSIILIIFSFGVYFYNKPTKTKTPFDDIRLEQTKAEVHKLLGKPNEKLFDNIEFYNIPFYDLPGELTVYYNENDEVYDFTWDFYAEDGKDFSDYKSVQQIEKYYQYIYGKPEGVYGVFLKYDGGKYTDLSIDYNDNNMKIRFEW